MDIEIKEEDIPMITEMAGNDLKKGELPKLTLDFFSVLATAIDGCQWKFSDFKRIEKTKGQLEALANFFGITPDLIKNIGNAVNKAEEDEKEKKVPMPDSISAMVDALAMASYQPLPDDVKIIAKPMDKFGNVQEENAEIIFDTTHDESKQQPNPTDL